MSSMSSLKDSIDKYKRLREMMEKHNGRPLLPGRMRLNTAIEMRVKDARKMISQALVEGDEATKDDLMIEAAELMRQAEDHLKNCLFHYAKVTLQNRFTARVRGLRKYNIPAKEAGSALEAFCSLFAKAGETQAFVPLTKISAFAWAVNDALEEAVGKQMNRRLESALEELEDLPEAVDADIGQPARLCLSRI
jgi:hypothetical protein